MAVHQGFGGLPRKQTMLKRRIGSFLLVIGLAALFLFVISLQAPQDNSQNTTANFNLFLIGFAASAAGFFLIKGSISENAESAPAERFRTVKRMAAIRRGDIPKSERKKRRRRKKKKDGDEEENGDTKNEGEAGDKPAE